MTLTIHCNVRPCPTCPTPSPTLSHPSGSTGASAGTDKAADEPTTTDATATDATATDGVATDGGDDNGGDNVDGNADVIDNGVSSTVAIAAVEPCNEEALASARAALHELRDDPIKLTDKIKGANATRPVSTPCQHNLPHTILTPLFTHHTTNSPIRSNVSALPSPCQHPPAPLTPSFVLSQVWRSVYRTVFEAKTPRCSKTLTHWRFGGGRRSAVPSIPNQPWPFVPPAKQLVHDMVINRPSTHSLDLLLLLTHSRTHYGHSSTRTHS